MSQVSSRITKFVLAALVALAAATAVWAATRDQHVPVQRLSIVNSYPHDPVAFTQGLVIRDGKLYESTGLYGRSTVREVDLTTGHVTRSASLDAKSFGEGLTLLNGELFLVTWKNGMGYVLDPETFALKRTFRYGGEGWGLTDDGKQLILSDGSSILRFLDPKSGNVVARLPVRAGNQPVDKLNELEYVDGEIYANIWYSDQIARISAETGEILGWIDGSSLRQNVDLADPREDVLNGIAYDRQTKDFYMTGKRWPKLFQVRIEE